MFILTWWGPFPALPTVSTTSSLWCTLIQVVGGRTAVPHRHGNHSSRLHFKLDCPLQCAGSSHLRPGPSVLFSSLVRIVTAVGHQTPPHHCLPPSSQRDGRESTPPAQGRLAGPRRHRRLDFSPPLGSTQNAGGSQRGLQLIFRGVSLWSPPSDSWPASWCTGAAAGGFPRSSQSGPLTHPRKESINSSASRVHPSCSG